MSRIHPSGIRRTLSDILELLRLQGRLMAIDSREAIKRVLVAAVLSCVAVALAIAACGTLLSGAGWLVSDYLEWSLGASLLLVGGIAVVVVVLILLGAYASLRRAAVALRDSADEMGTNLRWIQNRLVPEAAGESHGHTNGVARLSPQTERSTAGSHVGNGSTAGP